MSSRAVKRRRAVLLESISKLTGEERQDPAFPPERRGKRPGTLSVRTLWAKQQRELYVARLREEGLTPIDVMCENMVFAARMAQGLTDQFVAQLQEPPPLNAEEYRDWAQSMVNGLRSGMVYREMSQKCAVELAPYFHPKRSPIEEADKVDPDDVRVEVDVKFLEYRPAAPEEELMQAAE